MKNWKLKMRIALIIPLMFVIVYIVAQTGAIDMSSITGFATLGAKSNDVNDDNQIPAGLSGTIPDGNDYSIFTQDSSDKDKDKDKDKDDDNNQDQSDNQSDQDDNLEDGNNDTQIQTPPVLGGGGGGSSGGTPDDEPVVTLPIDDTTAPTLLNLNIEVTTIDDTKQNDINISIETDEPTSIKINDENGLVYSNTSLKTNRSILLTNQTDGNRLYNITFSDSSNNNYSIELSALIDTTAPEVIDYLVKIFDRDDDDNNNDVKLTLNLNESASTYAQIINSELNITNSIFSINPIFYFYNLSEGNYIGFDLNITDISGNVNNLSILSNINITKNVVEDNTTDNPPNGDSDGSTGAIPDIPANFWGQLYINDTVADAGETITATINDTEYQTTTVADGYYTVTVPGTGETVDFSYNYTVIETSSGIGGAVKELNLYF